jgi:flagellar motor switch/type III secretory pathway protein FliN
MKHLLARDFELSVVEPIIPVSSAREILFEEALTYRVRGYICDVFIVLRPLDARRLSATAFGETERSEKAPLSEVERATLERMLTAIAPLCVPLCGKIGMVTSEDARRAQTECVTYFEVRMSGTPSVAIGFALTSDPPEEVAPLLRIDDLLDVEIEARVECARGEVTFSSFCSLDRDSTVGLSESGILRFGEAAFARGSCGVRGGRHAFVLGSA